MLRHQRDIVTEYLTSKKAQSPAKKLSQRFSRQLSNQAVRLEIFRAGENSIRGSSGRPKAQLTEECDTDACRDGKFRSKNSCPRSSSGVGQNFRVRHGTFRRIYLDVSCSSARDRNMRVGIKFAWKSSRFISRVRSLCIQRRHPLRASTIILA